MSGIEREFVKEDIFDWIEGLQMRVEELERYAVMETSIVLPDADFESDWFAAAVSTVYTEAHGLASTPRLVMVWHSAVASPGAGDELVMALATYSQGSGWQVNSPNLGVDGTYVYISTGSTSVIASTRRTSATGYLKIMAWG